MRVGFEPTPFRTRSLVWRLRPLGHLTIQEVLLKNIMIVSICQTYSKENHIDHGERHDSVALIDLQPVDPGQTRKGEGLSGPINHPLSKGGLREYGLERIVDLMLLKAQIEDAGSAQDISSSCSRAYDRWERRV
jgi:hypothetical protein